MRWRWPNRDGESGAATVLAALLVAALLGLAAVIGVLGSAVVARHRAQSAADLGALAGAGELVAGPAVACRRAEAVAVAAGATVLGCTVESLDIVLQVQVPVALTVGNPATARATARAGPIHRTGSRSAG